MVGATSDIPQQQPAARVEVQEMSVQTTPGLALRTREVEKTPPRVPFSETLKQNQGTVSAEEQPRDDTKMDSPMDVQAGIDIVSKLESKLES